MCVPFTALPEELRRQIWSNNRSERGSPRDIPRALTPLAYFPTAPSSGLSAPCSLSNRNEWTEGRGSLGLDVLARCRLRLVRDTGAPSQEVTTTNHMPTQRMTGRRTTRQPSQTGHPRA